MKAMRGYNLLSSPGAAEVPGRWGCLLQELTNLISRARQLREAVRAAFSYTGLRVKQTGHLLASPSGQFKRNT